MAHNYKSLLGLLDSGVPQGFVLGAHLFPINVKGYAVILTVYLTA